MPSNGPGLRRLASPWAVDTGAPPTNSDIEFCHHKYITKVNISGHMPSGGPGHFRLASSRSVGRGSEPPCSAMHPCYNNFIVKVCRLRRHPIHWSYPAPPRLPRRNRLPTNKNRNATLLATNYYDIPLQCLVWCTR